MLEFYDYRAAYTSDDSTFDYRLRNYIFTNGNDMYTHVFTFLKVLHGNI